MIEAIGAIGAAGLLGCFVHFLVSRSENHRRDTWELVFLLAFIAGEDSPGWRLFFVVLLGATGFFWAENRVDRLKGRR